MAEDAENIEENKKDERSGWWRAGAIALKVLAVLLITQLVVIVFIILALHTKWGADQMRRLVVSQANLALHAEVHVDRLGGNFITRLNAYDVRLVQDGHVTARFDTASVGIRALPLLWRTVHLTDVYLSQPEFHGVQDADSVWNFQRLVEPAEPDTVPTPWKVRIKKFEMRDGTATMNFYHPEGDSIVRLYDLNMEASDFLVSAEDLFMDIDTLRARASAPGSPSPMSLNLSAGLQEHRFTIGGLRLISDSSNVWARGYIPLDDRIQTDSLYLFVEAHPFATQDLRAFLPALDLYGTMDLTVRAEGVDGLATAFIEGASLDGGRVDLQATTSLRTDEEIVYVVEGSIERINPAYFTHDPSMAALINAEIESDLRGPSLDRISGNAAIALTGSHWQHRSIRASNLTVDFEDGFGQFILDTGIGASQIAARGGGRFFDDIPTYAFNGSIERFNLAAVSGDPEDATNLSARFNVTGQGYETDAMVATAAITVLPSTYGDFRIDSGRLEASLRDGLLNFDARAGVLGGQIAAVGQLQPFEEDIRYRVSRGSFSDLNLAALDDDPQTSSSLTGSFALSGVGSDPGRMRLDASLQLAESRYDDLIIESAGLNARIERRDLLFDVQARTDAGFVAAEGRARPFDEPMSYALTRGRFEDLNLAVLMDDPEMQTALTGTIVLQGTGTDPETMSLTFQTALEPSVYRTEEIDLFEFEGDIEQGIISVSGRMQSTAGNLRLTGHFEPFAEVQGYTITEGVFANVNLGPWLADPDLQTDITGSLVLEGRGYDPEIATLDGRVEIAPSIINQEEIQTGTADVALADGLLQFSLDVATETGTVVASGSGRFFDPEPTYEASGQIVNVDVGRIGGIENIDTRLTLAFEFEGRGIEPETMQARGFLLGRDSRLLGSTVDTIQAHFDVSDGLARVDTLLIAGDMLQLDAGGIISLAPDLTGDQTDFNFAAEFRDLRPLRLVLDVDYFYGEGHIEGSIRGQRGSIRLLAEADLQHLAYDDIRVGRLRADVAGEQTAEGLMFTSRARADNLSMPTLVVERTNLQLVYDPEQLEFTGDLRIDRNRSGEIAGRLVMAEEQQLLELETLMLNLDEDRYELLQPATVSIVGEEYHIRNFMLFSDDQQIAIDGVIDLAGEQSLIFTAEDVNIEPFAELLAIEGLEGRLSATLVMSGPAADPDITGSLFVANLRSFGEAMGDAEIDLQYGDFRMEIDVRVDPDEDRSLVIDGSIPIDMSLVDTRRAPPESEIQLHVAANDFPLAIVRPFLDPETVERIEGRLSADIQITGQMDNPLLSGDLALRDGVLVLPDLGTTYREMQIDAVMEGNEMQISRAQIRSGRGGLTATGSINLAELALDQMGLDLDIQMRGFQAMETSVIRVTTGGDIRLTGTYTNPELTGGVVLERAEFFLSEELTGLDIEEVRLTERDLQVLESRFGIRVTPDDTVRFDFYESLAMDINVRIERNVWLRSRQSPKMDIEFTGQLDVQKQPFEDPLAFGSIETTPRSRVEQFGRRFEITTGNLVFNGPVTDPILDIRADYRVRARTRGGEPEAVITLALEGPLDDMRPEITSDPPMEMTDIVSYIATGRPASEGFFGGGAQDGEGGLIGEAGGLATGFLTGQMYQIFEGFAATELGLDIIDIHQDARGHTVMTAGKYISNDLFASLSRPLSRVQQDDEGAVTEVVLEYEVLRWLLIRASRRRAGPGIELLWEYTY